MDRDSQALTKIAEKVAWRFPRIAFDEAKSEIDNSYLVKKILDRGGNAMIYGPSGGGKTFFTIDLASHIACGVPWRCRRVVQAMVVYVAAEAGASIQRRFAAWRGAKLSDSREDRTPLVILTRGPNLLDEVEAAELIAELQTISEDLGMPLGLIVFDTLSRSIPGGDENSAHDMTRIVGVADRIRDQLGAATVYVHHSGKDSTRGARGHSALYAAADTVICVSDGVATLEKVRDGVSGEVFPFSLQIVELGIDQDGDPVTTCVIAASDEAPIERKQKLSATEGVALQALKDEAAQSGEILPATSDLPGGKRVVRIEAWQKRWRTSLGEADAKANTLRQAFFRGKTGLRDKKIIGMSEHFAWLW